MTSPETSTLNWEQFLETLSPQVRDRLSPAEADVPPPECFWYLVTWSEGHRPELQEFGEVNGLRQAIMDAWPSDKLLASDVMMFIFFGVRAKTTRGANPYLLHPNGSLLPLFTEDPIELCDDGLLNEREEVEIEETIEAADEFDQWTNAEVDEQEPADEEPYPEGFEAGVVSEEEPS